MVLIHVSLMNSGVEYLSLCLFTFLISSLANCSHLLPTSFELGCFILNIEFWKFFICIMSTNSLSDML